MPTATGARIVARCLVRQGITTIAGIPGGANLPLFDALAEEPIRIVLARHEQGAGFISQGMKLFAENYLEGEVGFTSSEADGTEFFVRLPLALGCKD